MKVGTVKKSFAYPRPLTLSLSKGLNGRPGLPKGYSFEKVQTLRQAPCFAKASQGWHQGERIDSVFFSKLSATTISMFLIFTFYFPLCATDLRVFEDRVAMNPSDHVALYNLGVAAFGIGDFKKASAAFSALKPCCAEGVQTPARAVEVFYNAGNAEYKLQDLQKALESFEAVLRYDPAHEKARQKRDFIKQQLEQPKRQEQQKQDKNEQQKDDQQDKQQQDSEQDQGDQSQKKQDQAENSQKSDQQQRDQQQQQQEEQQGKRDQKQSESQKQQGEKSDDNDQQQKGQQNKQQGGKDENQQGIQKEQQQAGAEGKKGEQLTARQQKLIAIAEQLDNRAQEQIVRQQAGMRAHAGGQHEW